MTHYLNTRFGHYEKQLLEGWQGDEKLKIKKKIHSLKDQHLDMLKTNKPST